jgi:transposase InsO family protein
MDFVGPFPVSSRGFDMVFTIVDRFSKLCCFIPMVSSATAFDVAQLFFENWICKYGVPNKIISDRDAKFTSNFWKSLIKVLQCKLALSTAYHPQTDGLSERFHRSIL